MSENFIRWFCPICNDFVSIRKTPDLYEKVQQVKRLPYPIIVKHGDPPHYTIVQLDRDLRDRGRLTSTDYIDLTAEPSPLPEHQISDHRVTQQLEDISKDLSKIQRKIWDILEK